MPRQKIIALMIILLCLQLPSPCQNAKTDEAGEKPPLRYRLIAVNPEVCPKDSLKLELELQNTSTHKVFIDGGGLLYSVTIVGERFATIPTGDRMGELTSDDLVSLAPGESYRKTLPY